MGVTDVDTPSISAMALSQHCFNNADVLKTNRKTLIATQMDNLNKVFQWISNLFFRCLKKYNS